MPMDLDDDDDDDAAPADEGEVLIDDDAEDEEGEDDDDEDDEDDEEEDDEEEDDGGEGAEVEFAEWLDAGDEADDADFRLQALDEDYVQTRVARVCLMKPDMSLAGHRMTHDYELRYRRIRREVRNDGRSSKRTAAKRASEMRRLMGHALLGDGVPFAQLLVEMTAFAALVANGVIGEFGPISDSPRSPVGHIAGMYIEACNVYIMFALGMRVDHEYTSLSSQAFEHDGNAMAWMPHALAAMFAFIETSIAQQHQTDAERESLLHLALMHTLPRLLSGIEVAMRLDRRRVSAPDRSRAPALWTATAALMPRAQRARLSRTARDMYRLFDNAEAGATCVELPNGVFIPGYSRSDLRSFADCMVLQMDRDMANARKAGLGRYLTETNIDADFARKGVSLGGAERIVSKFLHQEVPLLTDTERKANAARGLMADVRHRQIAAGPSSLPPPPVPTWDGMHSLDERFRFSFASSAPSPAAAASSAAAAASSSSSSSERRPDRPSDEDAKRQKKSAGRGGMMHSSDDDDEHTIAMSSPYVRDMIAAHGDDHEDDDIAPIGDRTFPVVSFTAVGLDLVQSSDDDEDDDDDDEDDDEDDDDDDDAEDGAEDDDDDAEDAEDAEDTDALIHPTTPGTAAADGAATIADMRAAIAARGEADMRAAIAARGEEQRLLDEADEDEQQRLLAMHVPVQGHRLTRAYASRREHAWRVRQTIAPCPEHTSARMRLLISQASYRIGIGGPLLCDGVSDERLFTEALAFAEQAMAIFRVPATNAGLFLEYTWFYLAFACGFDDPGHMARLHDDEATGRMLARLAVEAILRVRHADGPASRWTLLTAFISLAQLVHVVFVRPCGDTSDAESRQHRDMPPTLTAAEMERRGLRIVQAAVDSLPSERHATPLQRQPTAAPRLRRLIAAQAMAIWDHSSEQGLARVDAVLNRRLIPKVDTIKLAPYDYTHRPFPIVAWTMPGLRMLLDVVAPSAVRAANAKFQADADRIARERRVDDGEERKEGGGGDSRKRKDGDDDDDEGNKRQKMARGKSHITSLDADDYDDGERKEDVWYGAADWLNEANAARFNDDHLALDGAIARLSPARRREAHELAQRVVATMAGVEKSYIQLDGALFLTRFRDYYAHVVHALGARSIGDGVPMSDATAVEDFVDDEGLRAIDYQLHCESDPPFDPTVLTDLWGEIADADAFVERARELIPAIRAAFLRGDKLFISSTGTRFELQHIPRLRRLLVANGYAAPEFNPSTDPPGGFEYTYDRHRRVDDERPTPTGTHDTELERVYIICIHCDVRVAAPPIGHRLTQTRLDLAMWASRCLRSIRFDSLEERQRAVCAITGQPLLCDGVTDEQLLAEAKAFAHQVESAALKAIGYRWAGVCMAYVIVSCGARLADTGDYGWCDMHPIVDKWAHVIAEEWMRMHVDERGVAIHTWAAIGRVVFAEAGGFRDTPSFAAAARAVAQRVARRIGVDLRKRLVADAYEHRTAAIDEWDLARHFILPEDRDLASAKRSQVPKFLTSVPGRSDDPTKEKPRLNLTDQSNLIAEFLGGRGERLIAPRARDPNAAAEVQAMLVRERVARSAAAAAAAASSSDDVEMKEGDSRKRKDDKGDASNKRQKTTRGKSHITSLDADDYDDGERKEDVWYGAADWLNEANAARFNDDHLALDSAIDRLSPARRREAHELAQRVVAAMAGVEKSYVQLDGALFLTRFHDYYAHVAHTLGARDIAGAASVAVGEEEDDAMAIADDFVDDEELRDIDYWMHRVPWTPDMSLAVAFGGGVDDDGDVEDHDRVVAAGERARQLIHAIREAFRRGDKLYVSSTGIRFQLEHVPFLRWILADNDVPDPPAFDPSIDPPKGRFLRAPEQGDADRPHLRPQQELELEVVRLDGFGEYDVAVFEAPVGHRLAGAHYELVLYAFVCIRGIEFDSLAERQRAVRAITGRPLLCDGATDEELLAEARAFARQVDGVGNEAARSRTRWPVLCMVYLVIACGARFAILSDRAHNEMHPITDKWAHVIIAEWLSTFTDDDYYSFMTRNAITNVVAIEAGHRGYAMHAGTMGGAIAQRVARRIDVGIRRRIVDHARSIPDHTARVWMSFYRNFILPEDRDMAHAKRSQVPKFLTSVPGRSDDPTKEKPRLNLTDQSNLIAQFIGGHGARLIAPRARDPNAAAEVQAMLVRERVARGATAAAAAAASSSDDVEMKDGDSRKRKDNDGDDSSDDEGNKRQKTRGKGRIITSLDDGEERKEGDAWYGAADWLNEARAARFSNDDAALNGAIGRLSLARRREVRDLAQRVVAAMVDAPRSFIQLDDALFLTRFRDYYEQIARALADAAPVNAAERALFIDEDDTDLMDIDYWLHRKTGGPLPAVSLAAAFGPNASRATERARELIPAIRAAFRRGDKLFVSSTGTRFELEHIPRLRRILAAFGQAPPADPAIDPPVVTVQSIGARDGMRPRPLDAQHAADVGGVAIYGHGTPYVGAPPIGHRAIQAVISLAQHASRCLRGIRFDSLEERQRAVRAITGRQLLCDGVAREQIAAEARAFAHQVLATNQLGLNVEPMTVHLRMMYVAIAYGARVTTQGDAATDGRASFVTLDWAPMFVAEALRTRPTTDPYLSWVALELMYSACEIECGSNVPADSSIVRVVARRTATLVGVAIRRAIVENAKASTHHHTGHFVSNFILPEDRDMASAKRSQVSKFLTSVPGRSEDPTKKKPRLNLTDQSNLIAQFIGGHGARLIAPRARDPNAAAEVQAMLVRERVARSAASGDVEMKDEQDDDAPPRVLGDAPDPVDAEMTDPVDAAARANRRRRRVASLVVGGDDDDDDDTKRRRLYTATLDDVDDLSHFEALDIRDDGDDDGEEHKEEAAVAPRGGRSPRQDRDAKEIKRRKMRGKSNTAAASGGEERKETDDTEGDISEHLFQLTSGASVGWDLSDLTRTWPHRRVVRALALARHMVSRMEARIASDQFAPIDTDISEREYVQELGLLRGVIEHLNTHEREYATLARSQLMLHVKTKKPAMMEPHLAQHIASFLSPEQAPFATTAVPLTVFVRLLDADIHGLSRDKQRERLQELELRVPPQLRPRVAQMLVELAITNRQQLHDDLMRLYDDVLALALDPNAAIAASSSAPRPPPSHKRRDNDDDSDGDDEPRASKRLAR